MTEQNALNGSEGANGVTGVGVVACAVLEDEVEHLRPEGVVRVMTLPQGLHNNPPELRKRVQESVDELDRDERIEVIVLAYGLCSRGTEGVVSRRARLVIPRAHDCITLLLGSRERYAEEMARAPGTYWYSPGWNRNHLPPGPEREAELRRRFSEKYDPEDVEYLLESEQSYHEGYERAAYVHLTVGATESDRAYSRVCADWLGWRFEEIAGDPALVRDLLAGEWDGERYCVLRPGETLRMTADERIMEAVDAEPERPA